MARGRLIAAAAAGIAVSFVIFAVLALVTPDEGLQRGTSEVVWQRFQFESERVEFTEGSVAVILNRDAVPLDLFVAGPGDANTSFVLPPNGTAEVHLEDQGVYRVGAAVYGWGMTELEVRSSNPFVRFFEDLF